MVKVLIIEDEESIVKMIQYDLKQLDYHVDIALDGKIGYQKAMQERYDILVLDLMLPSMNGQEICRKLRETQKDLYIIMLTAMSEEFNKIEGFEAGADDYLTKPFSPRELTARIKAAVRRQKKSTRNECLTYEDITINTIRHEVSLGETRIELTLKEFELLEYLMRNKGIALSREQLLTSLWGYTYDGDTRVVDVHIFKLREKIAPLQQKIQTIRGVGYKLI